MLSLAECCKLKGTGYFPNKGKKLWTFCYKGANKQAGLISFSRRAVIAAQDMPQCPINLASFQFRFV